MGLIPVLAGALAGQSLFVKPVKVLGDPNFIGTSGSPLQYDSPGPNVVEGRELNQPLGVAVDLSVSPPVIYIADTGNNRVLGFRYNTQLTAGAFADIVLGQPDRFTTRAQGPSGALSTGLNSPSGLAVDSTGNLYVADSGNNRILRYPKPFSQPAGYQFPNMIIGQTSFSGATGNPTGVKPTSLLLSNNGSFFAHSGLTFDSSGNLWVADTGNNRIIRFPASVLQAGQNGPAADMVVGQADLNSSLGAPFPLATSNFALPTSVSFDSSGNMFVADSLHRVLAFQPPFGPSSSAFRVLGIDTSQNAPAVSAINAGFVTSALAAGGQVLVADNSNNRVLIYQPPADWPPQSFQFSPSALSVMGQASFSGSSANQSGQASVNTLNSPVDFAASSSELFVVDAGNNRVLVFPFSPAGVVTTPIRVIGQLDFPYNAPNLVEGKEFGFSGTVAGASGSAILDLSANPPHLYVADTQNNRILGFKDFTHVVNGQKADLVIGQPDFLHTVVNYPSNSASTPNQQGLNGPTGLAIDSAGNLYVADTFNSRVLRFPAPFASGMTALESADLVIGQADFVSIVTDPTPRTMSAPISVALTMGAANAASTTPGFLAVADPNHNRVLMFPKPFANGMSATVVIGQPDFNFTTASSNPTRLNGPRAVAVDPLDRVLIADSGNDRIQVFGQAASLSSFATPSFSLHNNLTDPVAIGFSQTGQFWVADSQANQLVHYPSVDQLPLKNYLPDATQPAVSPRSAFVDQFNNLLIADGINRLLYFAPALGVVNAASFIPSRPLAPGTAAAVFPSVSTNVLSTGTASATAFPLPTSLSDTEVLVGGNPAPLFYVSPGQINLPLPMSLPTAGTVDLQVVRVSTGQVYGGAEVALNTASPGLFTLGGSGTGGVAAINAVDGSVNGPGNPVTRGQYISLYGTGQGAVAGAPPDGMPATGVTPTSSNPQILLGGTGSTYTAVPPANVTYSGLAPGLTGVWQINFLVPQSASSGSAVPIKVLMNSIPSDNPSPPPAIATTIAIK